MLMDLELQNQVLCLIDNAVEFDPEATAYLE